MPLQPCRLALLALLLVAACGAPAGPGEDPQPSGTGPSASCLGHCGSQAPSGCSCTADCAQTGDCCLDAAGLCTASCPGLAPPSPDFCLDGKTEPVVDNGGCTTGFRCVRDEPGCEDVAGPDDGFCPDGAVEPELDSDGCITGYTCAEESCPEIVRPDPGSCPGGRFEPRLDPAGCTTGFDCVKDAPDCEELSEPGPGFCPDGMVRPELDADGCTTGYACHTAPPADSCVGRCGDTAPSGCSCSVTCSAGGSCCTDRVAACTTDARYDPVAGLRNSALINGLRALVANNSACTYNDARDYLFGQLDVHNGKLECVYTGRLVSPDGTRTPGDFNTEHSWPQSRGATGIAKCDLHHLFPSDEFANSLRGNDPFGVTGCPATGCKEACRNAAQCDTSGGRSVSGPSAAGGGTVFEVRARSGGNIARALFYFSVRYSLPIPANEEATLRDWHQADPPDADERARNDGIERQQNNRNPFVDRPDFVDLIADF